MTTQTLRALTRELATLTTSPPEGVRVQITNEADLLGNGGIVGIVQGPAGTPYEGGYFRIRFAFGEGDFPNTPPKCTMISKIFHPNISKTGEICVDTLKKGWKREYGIGHVLVTIKCLLIVPNPESALDEEAGKLLLEDYQEYYKRAKLMTGIHAVPKTPPEEFADELASSKPIPTTTQKPATMLPLQPHSHAINAGVSKPAEQTVPMKKVVNTTAAAKAKRGLKRL
ncbi:hypothetical protein NliqN6_3792 [Naganishia liquefaciens]|uniref:E2 ubiquitin-conjugating enzyme n=1 Tax=Naganishia liquefaciens TaxID=104408 RepID=A0A8H3TVD1_9TREE|nr:hypothetical protein NliqN6_3792 [Naganishia liquefaciens]